MRRAWATARAVLVLLLIGLAPLGAAAQLIGLTFEDGLDPVRDARAKRWNTRILNTLRDEQLHAIVFPSLARSGRGEAALALIREWADGGHGVGNLTAGHRSLSSPKVTLTGFIADVQRAHEVLSTLPGFVPLLRFPYLKEGDTRAKRDGMRAWLRDNGYRAAPVSIDTSDRYYDERFLALSKAGRREPMERLKRAYVRHLLDRAAYYDTLARQLFGSSPTHVMRLHVNAINAAALGDVIEAFRAKGWHFVAARTALEDPLYAMQPDTLPAGESIVWALAKEHGIEDLRVPAEAPAYERPLLRRQGLAP